VTVVGLTPSVSGRTRSASGTNCRPKRRTVAPRTNIATASRGRLQLRSRRPSPADAVWAVVSDAGNISCWFPSVQTSEAAGGERHRVLEGGVPLEEEIVTSDDDLRRFRCICVRALCSAAEQLVASCSSWGLTLAGSSGMMRRTLSVCAPDAEEPNRQDQKEVAQTENVHVSETPLGV